MVVLCVGDRGVEQLQDVDRGGRGESTQDGTRVVNRLAADVVDDEPGLARGTADVLGLCPDGSFYLPVLLLGYL